MIKSAIGIITKKTSNKWIVDILRSLNNNGTKKEKIRVILYLDDFRCNISNNQFCIQDVIYFHYDKKCIDGCNRIFVYNVAKLSNETTHGILRSIVINNVTYPSIVSYHNCKTVLHVIYNVEVYDIPIKYMKKNVVAKYALLDPCDFNMNTSDLDCKFDDIKLICLVKLSTPIPPCPSFTTTVDPTENTTIEEESTTIESTTLSTTTILPSTTETTCAPCPPFPPCEDYKIYILILKYLRLILFFFVIFLLLKLFWYLFLCC